MFKQLSIYCLIFYSLLFATASSHAAIDKTELIESNNEVIEVLSTQGAPEKLQSNLKKLSRLLTEIQPYNSRLSQAKTTQATNLIVSQSNTLFEIQEALVSIQKVTTDAIIDIATKEKLVIVIKDGTQLLDELIIENIEDAQSNLRALYQIFENAEESRIAELKLLLSSARNNIDEILTQRVTLLSFMQKLNLDTVATEQHLDAYLVSRAELLMSRLENLIDERKGYHDQLSGRIDSDRQNIEQKIASLELNIDSLSENLRTTVDLMSERQLDTAEYKQFLVTSTGEITSDIFESDVAIVLLQQWLGSARTWLMENGPQMVFKLILFALIFCLFVFLSNVASRLVDKALSSSRINTTTLLKDLFVSIAGKLVLIIGLLIGLSQLGFQIGPVLAGLGIAGFIIGFALQETLSNFAAGLMILIYRPFDVGDAIEAAGISGVVKQMNLVSTTINTFDNKKIIVPNSKVWGDVICNINAEPTRRIDMIFGIGYSDDIDKANAILSDIISSHEKILEDPAPTIKLHSLGESSVDFIVRPWVKSEDYWGTYWDVTRDVKKRFDQEGITIPFPQRDVHLFQHGSQPA